MEKLIDGVLIKEIKTNSDDRGYFREIIRSSDEIFEEGFGQCSHSVVFQGITKAWHLHKYQYQWTYVASGTLKVVLYDTRSESPTYNLKNELLVGGTYKPIVYLIPPGVAHGYRCLSGPAHVFYLTSGEYDLSDEIRIPYNDLSINFDWSRDIEIK